MKQYKSSGKQKQYNYRLAYLKIAASFVIFIFVLTICKISPYCKQRVKETLYTSYDVKTIADNSKHIFDGCINKVKTFNNTYKREE